MSLLSELTLLIPTYNRQRYALRSMRYWSGSAVTVQVLDGSARPIPSEELAGLADDVNYRHMPVSAMERLRKAVDLMQTKYVALLEDDESFIPNTLQACIRALEADATLASCRGRCLDFRPVADHVIVWLAYTFGSVLFLLVGWVVAGSELKGLICEQLRSFGIKMSVKAP